MQQAVRNNWDGQALTDFRGQTFTYRDVARKIAKLHILFKGAGLEKGDRVALCGRNSAAWSIAAMAVLTYGAVAVPILHDFKPDTIHHLVNHSGARLLFADAHTDENLDRNAMPNLEGAVLLADYSLLMSRNKSLEQTRRHLNEIFGRTYPDRFTANDVVYAQTPPEATVLINYTSGSTGFSKGVMLSERALWSNLQFCIDGLDFLKPGDAMVSMLPLAHMFGFMVEMIHPFVKGCHINFLTRTPSPRIITEAFAAVRPKLIVTVPLVIEKIIRQRVFPVLDKPLMKLLLHVPFVDEHVLQNVKDKLTAVFGGNLREIIIGGAGLNKDVETFLRRIDFPFTVGYGMTECGPLISYCPWQTQRPGSCGRAVDRMQVRVDSPDPANVPGVLWVKGDNVMNGYFKNPAETQAVLDKDGWMNTGDICTVDNDGYIYIRGRDKNLILGPSGQNIYPEEIEQKLNTMPYVAESIVIDGSDGKLVALIHPDFENAQKQDIDDTQLNDIMARNIAELNPQLPAYSKITAFRIHAEEFEKTPKRSIKRFLYQPH